MKKSFRLPGMALVVVFFVGLMSQWSQAQVRFPKDWADFKIGTYDVTSAGGGYKFKMKIDSKERKRWIFHGIIKVTWHAQGHAVGSRNDVRVQQMQDNSLNMVRYIPEAGGNQRLVTNKPSLVVIKGRPAVVWNGLWSGLHAGHRNRGRVTKWLD